jgi:hypothetical protein
MLMIEKTNHKNIHRINAEIFVSKLFSTGRPATFVANNFKLKREFMCSEEVLSLTELYLKKLINIWEMNFPEVAINFYNESIHAKEAITLNQDLNIEHHNAMNNKIDVNNKVNIQDKSDEFKRVSIISSDNDKSFLSETKTRMSIDEIKDLTKNIPLYNESAKSLNVKKTIGLDQPNKSTKIEDYSSEKLYLSDSRSLPKETTIQSKPTGINAGTIPATSLIQKNITPLTPSFTIPANARIGENFNCKIFGKLSDNCVLQILDVIIPSEIGLKFDSITQELQGIPLISGEHTLSLQWREPNSTTRSSGQCLLVIIPDAKSLWKNIDPPKDDPYPKLNEDSALLRTKDFNIAAASTRGRSHAHVGSFRDDDFYISHDAASGWSVVIVADGAGSARNSRWGSKLAVEAAGHHLSNNLAGDTGHTLNSLISNWYTDATNVKKDISDKFYYLFQESSVAAIKSIEKEAANKGVTPKEYSTTLLAAAVKRVGKDIFLSTFWMGDGAIAVYGPSGKVRLMGTPDSGEFAGQTRFLDRAALSDQATFSKRITIGLCSDVTSVILMTDGISDPRFETDNGLLDPLKWDSLWTEISPYLASETPELDLVKWLDFLTPGHHDDRTIALLW